jgi:hypothetical protein
MAALLLPSRLRQQPRGNAVRVDWSNTITQGLVIAVLPGSRGNLANNELLTQASGYTRDFNRIGAVTTAESLKWPEPANSSDVGAEYDLNILTAFVFGLQTSVQNAAATFARGQGSSTFNGWSIGFHGGSNNGAEAEVCGQFLTPSGNFADVTTPTAALLTVDSTSGLNLFCNGKLQNTGTYTTPTYQYSPGTGRGVIFGSKTGPGNATTNQLAIGLLWNRVLNSAEIASISANPWQIFRTPPARRIWVPASSSSTAINPSVGNIVISGYAPTIAKPLAVTPSQGTLSLTGNAPSVAQTVTPAAVFVPTKLTQQPQGMVQVNPNLKADLAWIASIGSVAGPDVIRPNASTVINQGGVAITSGYATVNGGVPSLYTTSWTEIGVVLLDATHTVNTLGTRPNGQTVSFSPGTSLVDLVMWAVTDVNISAGTLPVGMVRYVARRSGNSHSVWINGQLYGTASSASTPVTSSGVAPAIGAQAADGVNVGGAPLAAGTGVSMVVRTRLVLPDAQCQELSSNPWQVFNPPKKKVWALGSLAIAVNPNVGSLSITGYAPVLTRSTNIVPTNGAISITGYTPTIAQPIAISPTNGTVSLTGYAPTIAKPIAVNPANGAITLTGYAPAISQPVGINPANGTVSFTGYAPTIAQPTGIAPSNGAITISGYAPSVASGITPGVGTVTFSGLAPALVQSVNQWVNPAVGSFAITGYAPAVTLNYNIKPLVGSVGITGLQPAVSQQIYLNPINGSLAVSGFAPSVQNTNNQILSPITCAIIVTGSAPIVDRQNNGVRVILSVAAQDTILTIAPSGNILPVAGDNRILRIPS